MNNKKVFPDRETFERIYEKCLDNQPPSDAFQRALFDDVKDETERKFMEYLALLEKEKFKYGYECGYRAGLNDVEQPFSDEGKTYKDGVREGQIQTWEICRKIFCDKENGGLPVRALKEIFRETLGVEDLFMRYEVQDVIDKIKAWENKNDICVGDIVTINITGEKGAVTRIRDEVYGILYEDGSIYFQGKTDIKKTGRHINITGLLAQIGGKNNER